MELVYPWHQVIQVAQQLRPRLLSWIVVIYSEKAPKDEGEMIKDVIPRLQNW